MSKGKHGIITKHGIAVTLDIELIKQLDDECGLVSRSIYINAILLRQKKNGRIKCL